MRPLLYLLVFPTILLAAPELRVGFAEVDVSPKLDPKKPVYMAGFGHNRLATKVHDPIMARAVILGDGTKKIAWVNVDVVGLFFPVAVDVRGQLKGFDYVAVCSTHNHEGPDTLGLWGRSPFESGLEPEYQKRIVAGCVEAITTADKALSPAVARIGLANDASLLRDGRLPEVKHDEILTLRFDKPGAKADDKPLGVLVQWNVHPELLSDKNTELSADHVGYTVSYLKQQFGCPVAYFTGTVGGLMTNLSLPLKGKNGELLKDGTFEKTEAYGVAVGKLAEKALGTVKEITLTPFTLRFSAVMLPVENPLYRMAWTAGVLKRSMYEWTGEAQPKEWKLAKDAKKTVGLKTEVGLLSLGELDVALIPGEIYPELVLDKIQEPVDAGADFPDASKEPAIYPQMKGKYKMLIGLANDEIGYIIPKRQWDEQKPYCYGLKNAQYGEINSCGPNVAPVLCEAFKGLGKSK